VYVNEGLELAEASRYERDGRDIGMIPETERNLGGHEVQG